MLSRRQTHWLTALITLAGAASASVVVAHALHGSLATPPAQGSRTAGGPAQQTPAVVAAVAANPRPMADQVRGRNVYEARVRPPTREAAEENELAASPPRRQVAEKSAAPRCAGALRLVGSIVNTVHPERSLAAVSQDGKTHLMVPGRRLHDLTLSTVHRTEARLRAADGTQCWISFAAPLVEARPKKAAAVAVKPAPVVPAAPEGKRTFEQYYSPEELELGVRPLGRQGYAVSREIVLLALSDPGKASAGAHFRAVKGDGRGAGMEVRKVRDGSLLARIGLQSGDVVRSLSGADLTTANGLLTSLRKLRQDDSVTMVVVRDGVERSVHYALD